MEFNIQLFIKDLLLYEFKRLSIPQGHHKISLQNNELIIVANSEEYNYPKKCNIEILTKLFPIETHININDKLIITFKQKINNDKLLLYREYPSFYFIALTITNINYVELYKQLKSHFIGVNTQITQELFTNICIFDDTYYTELYNRNYLNDIE